MNDLEKLHLEKLYPTKSSFNMAPRHCFNVTLTGEKVHHISTPLLLYFPRY